MHSYIVSFKAEFFRCFYFVIVVFLFGACTVPENTLEQQITFEEYNNIKLNSEVFSISQKYVGSDQSESTGFRVNSSNYLIAIELKKIDSMIQMPKGLYFKGLKLVDDGDGFDEIADDGIYTSTEYLKITEDMPDKSNIDKWVSILGNSKPNAWCVGCNDIDLSGPGEECLDEGTCPEFDWWTTWFCVCGSDCYVCTGDDCECENN